MLYIGEFRNKNDELYKVVIDSGATASRNITLTSTPIVIELEGNGGSDIFKPIKYSSATISVLTNGTNDYMFDIFTSTPQQVSVMLQKVNEEAHISDILWQGYVEPSIYDMGFNTDKEEFEIDCIDDLATLKYFKYTPAGLPTIKSFLDILLYIFRRHTRYKKLYVTNRFAYGNFDETITLAKLFISERNFINDGDNSDSWDEQEVIEEICNYLNVSLVAEGQDLYMLDYSTNGNYTVYDIASAASSYESIHNWETIYGEDYAQSGSTISMNPAFNRVSVTSKVNSYEIIIPKLFDDSVYTSKTNLGEWKINWYNGNIITNGSTAEVYATYVLVDNPNYNIYTYNPDGTPRVVLWDANYSQDFFLQTLRSLVGCFLFKTKFKNHPHTNSVGGFTSWSQEDWKDYLLIANHDTNKVLKVLETNAVSNDGYYVNNDAYLVVNCTALFMDKENWEYIPQLYSSDKNFQAKHMYIPAVIKWGDYYFNNAVLGEIQQLDSIDTSFSTGGRWTTEFTACKLQFDGTDTSKLINTPHNILDTSGYYEDKIESGLIIPPPPTPQTTAPTIALYTKGSRINNDVRNEYIWISDFSFKLVIPRKHTVLEEDWESDTEYCNIINENYVEDGSDIECKVNTYDSKVPSFSSVLFKRSEQEDFIYLDEVKCLGNNEVHRIEEHKIFDYVSQYREPSLTLEINHNDLHLPINTNFTVPIISTTKRFILDSYTKDYYNITNKIKIIEKKWIF